MILINTLCAIYLLYRYFSCYGKCVVGLGVGGEVAMLVVERFRAKSSVTFAKGQYGQWTKLTADQPRGRSLGYGNNAPPLTQQLLEPREIIWDISIG